jgi:hypothetical protein
MMWVAGAMALASMLLATQAHARGVNLSWSRCHGDGGTQNRTFACDTNAGTEVLVCSFVLDDPMSQVSGNEVVLEVLSEDDPLPTWWQFKDVGTCRQTSLGMNTIEDVNDVVCTDWASGQSVGGIGAYNQELGTVDPSLTTRHRRLKIALAVPLAGLAELAAGQEYFSCNVTINHAKTVGTGACAGCAGSVCLLLASLKVTTSIAANDVTLNQAAVSGSNIVQWQGPGANCQLVPVKRTTWGRVKGRYR